MIRTPPLISSKAAHHRVEHTYQLSAKVLRVDPAQSYAVGFAVADHDDVITVIAR